MNDETNLTTELFNTLKHAPNGLSEYALLQHLKANAAEHLLSGSLSDSLTLFRSHFILFNALYRLRDELWQSLRYHLQINPLQIQLLPYTPGCAGLNTADQLREYYLDDRNLHDSNAQAVEHLLQNFWVQVYAGDEKQAALLLFELDKCDQPINFAQIKKRFRQLVSQHHPDRGGSTERLQGINAAMDILQRHYSAP